jgi:hypothetical protein
MVYRDNPLNDEPTVILPGVASGDAHGDEPTVILRGTFPSGVRRGALEDEPTAILPGIGPDTARKRLPEDEPTVILPGIGLSGGHRGSLAQQLPPSRLGEKLCHALLMTSVVGIALITTYVGGQAGRTEQGALPLAMQPWLRIAVSGDAPDGNGPGYYLLLRAWTLTAGASSGALQVLAYLCAVAAACAMYVLVLRLASAPIAWTAAWLAALAPLLLRVPEAGGSWSFRAAVICVMLLLFVRALDRPTVWRWLTCGLCGVSLLSVRPSAVALVPALLLAGVCALRYSRRGMLGLLLMCLLVSASVLLFTTPEQIADRMPAVSVLGMTLQVFATGGIGSITTTLVTAAISLLALVGAWHLAAVRLRSAGILLLCAVGMPVTLYFSALIGQVYSITSALIAWPAFMILVAAGIVAEISAIAATGDRLLIRVSRRYAVARQARAHRLGDSLITEAVKIFPITDATMKLFRFVTPSEYRARVTGEPRLGLGTGDAEPKGSLRDKKKGGSVTDARP